MKYILIFVVAIAVLIVALTIGANNDQVVEFNYFIAKSSLNLSTLVAILFGLGLILGWLITGFFYLKLKVKNMGLNRRIKKQEQEIAKLNEVQKINAEQALAKD